MTSRTTKCHSCNAPIIFLPTKLNKMIPVNAETVRNQDVLFDSKFHVSHFATCPAAERHRKPRQIATR